MFTEKDQGLSRSSMGDFLLLEWGSEGVSLSSSKLLSVKVSLN
jgi:hypothetical protein